MDQNLVKIYHEGSRALADADPGMKKVYDIVGPLDPIFKEDYFKSLVKSILSQQLSTKAAATITGRMEQMIEGTYRPERLASFDQDQYRAVGVSRQKFSYIADLCRHFMERPEFFDNLPAQTDLDIQEKLTEIRGIGVWTAQMFLMFTLGRVNVFAPDDVGLRNGIQHLYGMEEKLSRKKLDDYAMRWKPYRTIASRYLWHSLKPEVAQHL